MYLKLRDEHTNNKLLFIYSRDIIVNIKETSNCPNNFTQIFRKAYHRVNFKSIVTIKKNDLK
jgi:hypothetical protein